MKKKYYIESIIIFFGIMFIQCTQNLKNENKEQKSYDLKFEFSSFMKDVICGELQNEIKFVFNEPYYYKDLKPIFRHENSWLGEFFDLNDTSEVEWVVEQTNVFVDSTPMWSDYDMCVFGGYFNDEFNLLDNNGNLKTNKTLIELDSINANGGFGLRMAKDIYYSYTKLSIPYFSSDFQKAFIMTVDNYDWSNKQVKYLFYERKSDGWKLAKRR